MILLADVSVTYNTVAARCCGAPHITHDAGAAARNPPSAFINARLLLSVHCTLHVHTSPCWHAYAHQGV